MFYYPLLLVTFSISTILCKSEWRNSATNQYHIQTDEGLERYFKYETLSGQYRKEKRLKDGTVVGTYAWIDNDGLLRKRDYIADDGGYRILKTQNIFVGKHVSVGDALKATRRNYFAKPLPNPEISNTFTTISPLYKIPKFTASNQLDAKNYPYTLDGLFNKKYTPVVTPIQDDYQIAYQAQTHRNIDQLKDTPSFQSDPIYHNAAEIQSRDIGTVHPHYEIFMTNDGFRYYIPRAYHGEQTIDNTRSGSFGYIDPFGIRRVIYYNTSPTSGFQHRKNNRYVGFQATPYDPGL